MGGPAVCHQRQSRGQPSHGIGTARRLTPLRRRDACPLPPAARPPPLAGAPSDSGEETPAAVVLPAACEVFGSFVSMVLAIVSKTPHSRTRRHSEMTTRRDTVRAALALAAGAS